MSRLIQYHKKIFSLENLSKLTKLANIHHIFLWEGFLHKLLNDLKLCFRDQNIKLFTTFTFTSFTGLNTNRLQSGPSYRIQFPNACHIFSSVNHLAICVVYSTGQKIIFFLTSQYGRIWFQLTALKKYRLPWIISLRLC